MPWYIATRPQTVLSLVQVGRLPDLLPTWWTAERTLRFFQSPLACAKTSTDRMNQTFLLEAELPQAERSAQITSVKTAAGIEQYRQAVQIDKIWLKRICVNTVGAQRLLNNLFNRAGPLPIEVVSDFFPQRAVRSPLPFFAEPPPPEPFSARAAGAEIKNLRYIRQGDLLGSRHQTLVNTVNCVGIMGKGIAYTFKLRYPEMFADYQQKCRQGNVRLGQPYLYKCSPWRWILNFPTKQHWKNSSNLRDLAAGLIYLAQNIERWGITSLSIPPLGCGNGGLNWGDVQPLIERYLGGLQIPIEIYVPFVRPDRRRRAITIPVAKAAAAMAAYPTPRLFAERRATDEVPAAAGGDDKQRKQHRGNSQSKRARAAVPKAKTPGNK